MAEEELRQGDLPPSRQIMQFIWPAIGAAQAVHVAAKLGIADLLAAGSKGADELADATGTHSPPLGRLMRALAGLGVFAEDAAGRFRNTRLGEALRRDHPESIRPWAVFLAASFCWRAWSELYETVRSGEPAFERVFGMPYYEYLARHPDDAAVFNAAMSSRSYLEAAAYDFSRFARIVDVGGGHGALLHAILSANPKLHGVLYDLPEVVAGADRMRDGAVGSRCEIVGGSFFDSVPQGADAYVLSGVIHNWDDEDALKILKNCRRAIPPDGTLLLLETVLKPNDAATCLMDLLMLVLVAGRERTESEFRELFRKAGFSLTRVIPTPSHSLVEARPV